MVEVGGVRRRRRGSDFPGQRRADAGIGADQGVQQAGAAAGQSENEHRALDLDLGDLGMALPIRGDRRQAREIVSEQGQSAPAPG